MGQEQMGFPRSGFDRRDVSLASEVLWPSVESLVVVPCWQPGYCGEESSLDPDSLVHSTAMS